MKRVLIVFAIAGCSKKTSDPGNAITKHELAVPADREWRNVDGPSALGEFATAARTAHLKPYAYLHASWCGPCNEIEKTHAADAQMADAFKGTAIALIDVDAADAADPGA